MFKVTVTVLSLAIAALGAVIAWQFAENLYSTAVSAEWARQLELTPSQYAKWRANLKKNAFSEKNIDMLAANVPRLRKICQPPPFGHPDYRNIGVCGALKFIESLNP